MQSKNEGSVYSENRGFLWVNFAVGLFSTCINSESSSMWASYGDNHCGFCIGFNTILLAQSLKCGFGQVDYRNEPIIVDISEPLNLEDATEYYQKTTEWSNEEEFRFLQYGIMNDMDRRIIFPNEAVVEILIGYKAESETINEIIEESSKINLVVPIYKLEPSDSGRGFKKVLLT